MQLAEIIAIEVGSAIAKSILKLWLKDSALGEDISSSLIDLLKSRTSDTLAQRRGQRQFDAIGEKVGESLLPLFEIEGSRLDEGSRTAVALAVAEAFNNLKLSSELLAKHSLEPTKLAKHVLATNPTGIQLFSEAENAFYQRIIEESCAYIVDIASQLPSFTENTFAEVLQREDRIITLANKILQEVRRIRDKIDPMTEAGRFEEDYCKTVARKLDELQLFGTNLSNASRRHRLSVAYITLSVAQKSPLLTKTEHNTGIVKAKVSEDAHTEAILDRIPVDTALARSHRLFIRGPAGSGKTTLLQWIAVKSSSRSFNGYLSDLNNTLPFFIRLRQFVQAELPRPEAFPGLVAPSIADTMPKGWAHMQLESGRAIVLVDGLDEVPLLRRENVRFWLKELLDVFPQARFILTSRPHATAEDWMDHEGFSNAELQPMQLSDIYTFIKHWHMAVKDELYEDAEKAELESLDNHLKENVKRNRSLQNLATNPLLCAMLCALNRDRRQQLPANRVELYEACCSLLLERRDKERHIELIDYPVLNYNQKRRLLEDLAYWMIKNNWSEVASELVDERFERKLRNMTSISHDISGERVRQFFVERAGIIREPGAGQTDFAHRTFQEFLAAQAAIDEMDIGVLVTNAHNDQWREVIILAAGLASQRTCEQLINELIARGDREKEFRYLLHLLAVSCFETSVELSQDIRAEVDKRLNELIPPKNMMDAEALAAAGELAVKYLAKKNGYSATITAACIHTLSVIGGDSALETLEGYANNPSLPIVDELLNAWDSFERETYARQVLSHALQYSSNLSMENPPSLDGVQYFTSLTELQLSDCSAVSDLSPLKDLTQLTKLNLSDCSAVSDLSPLAALTELTELHLSDCSAVSDLSPLADLIQLKVLNLSGCSHLSVFDLLSLTQLEKLDLSGCSQLSTIKLAGMAKLRELDLTNCYQVSNLSSLAELMQLKTLYLLGCTQVTDLSVLARLDSLRQIVRAFHNSDSSQV
jgi:NACHT domain